jgi:hypothetical protein
MMNPTHRLESKNLPSETVGVIEIDDFGLSLLEWGVNVVCGLDGRLDGFGAGEETAVDCINNRLSADLSAAKESTVETFNSVLASLDAVEFEINVSLRIWI